jgi:hypothetical protein
LNQLGQLLALGIFDTMYFHFKKNTPNRFHKSFAKRQINFARQMTLANIRN